MQLAQQPNPPPAGHYCISKWRLLRHTASLNIPEGLLAQQDPGLMRKLPLLSPLLHPLFIIAFLIKHATTSFPILPHTLFPRHIPRRPLWKIKSQPTKRCLWYMQKQHPAVRNSALPSENLPSQGEWAELCTLRGAAAEQVRRAETRSQPSPRCWPIPSFVLLCYSEISITPWGAGCQGRGFWNLCHGLTLGFPRMTNSVLHCSCGPLSQPEQFQRSLANPVDCTTNCICFHMFKLILNILEWLWLK